MSTERDFQVSRKLQDIADTIQVDVESELVRLRTRAERPSRPGRWSILMVAATILVGALAGGYAIGQRTAAADGTGPPPTSDQDFVRRWGGQILWFEETNGTLVTTTSDQVSVLPSELEGQASVVSSNGDVLSFVDDELHIYESNETSRPTGNETGVVSVSWDPSGMNYGLEECSPSGSVACTLKVGAADSSELKTLVPSSGRKVSWSPDGGEIAFIDGHDRLAVVDVNSGQVETVVSPGDVDASILLRPSWSPDGNSIAVVAQGAQGFFPSVFSTNGQLIARGGESALSPPTLAWGSGDELFVAEGPVEAYRPGMTASLWRLGAPDWTPQLLLAAPGELSRGVFVSPSEGVLLFQTANAQGLQNNAGIGPVEHVWYVIDRDERRLLDRSLGSGQILGWVTDGTD